MKFPRKQPSKQAQEQLQQPKTTLKPPTGTYDLPTLSHPAIPGRSRPETRSRYIWNLISQRPGFEPIQLAILYLHDPEFEAINQIMCLGDHRHEPSRDDPRLHMT